MVKLAWGLKRTCQSCGARFYDLQRSPSNCPKCGSIFEAVTTTKRGRTRNTVDTSKVISFGVEDELLDADLDLDVAIDDDSIDTVLMDDGSDIGEDLPEMADIDDENTDNL